MYIHIYIYIYIAALLQALQRSIRLGDLEGGHAALKQMLELREMGGAPRNPAPGNHFLVRIVKPSGCHCTDGHLTSRVFTEDQNIS